MRTPRALPVYPWGDNEKLYFGDGNDYCIYYDGTNFLIDSGTHEMEIDLATATKCKIYGGLASGDDIEIHPNATDALPYLAMDGNGDVRLYLKASSGFLIIDAAEPIGRIDNEGTYFVSGHTTGYGLKVNYRAITTTGNIDGLEINATTGLTMGVNFGVTGLKIAVATANGLGESYGIDVSGVPNTETTLKYLNTADAVTATVGTDAPNNWIKCAIGATAYYIACWTVNGA